MTDLLGGHVQMQFVFNAAQVVSNAKIGKLRALAVTSRERLSNVPELPTMEEAASKATKRSCGTALWRPSERRVISFRG
jgi:tripartite-type tricarboxylate transporter receptor subunit TctC